RQDYESPVSKGRRIVEVERSDVWSDESTYQLANQLTNIQYQTRLVGKPSSCITYLQPNTLTSLGQKETDQRKPYKFNADSDWYRRNSLIGHAFPTTLRAQNVTNTTSSSSLRFTNWRKIDSQHQRMTKDRSRHFILQRNKGILAKQRVSGNIDKKQMHSFIKQIKAKFGSS
ncbi:MAG: hypothetical protein EZS28_035286, partial [Streblomastix strix]